MSIVDKASELLTSDDVASRCVSCIAISITQIGVPQVSCEQFDGLNIASLCTVLPLACKVTTITRVECDACSFLGSSSWDSHHAPAVWIGTGNEKKTQLYLFSLCFQDLMHTVKDRG